jgi:subtilisin-like proprotein convertase family protein
MPLLLAATCAQATLSWVSQTFTSGVTIPAGNPVGVEATGNFTAASAGSAVLGITVDLNISGGYNGSLAAYLVAPNGTVVMLMDQPGVGMDGFGASSSGMNVTLSDAGSTSIQNVTGGSGTLTGIYQADQTLGTFNNSSADGAWAIYFTDLASGGGNPVLNSFTLDIEVPEPVTMALVVFLGLVVLHWCLGQFWTAPASKATIAWEEGQHDH